MALRVFEFRKTHLHLAILRMDIFKFTKNYFCHVMILSTEIITLHLLLNVINNGTASLPSLPLNLNLIAILC